MVICRACKRELVDDGIRRPCPDCGSTSVAYDEGLAETVSLGESLQVEQARDGERSKAILDDALGIRFWITGRSPRNEEGAQDACARLVDGLNQEGGHWSQPQDLDQDNDADCRSTDGGHRLDMQVVRASRDQDLWQTLGQVGNVARNLDCDGVADQLIEVVAHKAGRYPIDRRRELVLVIDASMLPGHTFQQVIDRFRQRHAARGAELEFRAIFAVGSNPVNVTRLDDGRPVVAGN